jgi:ubiquinone/menaquinone biosynthesis C-methylase UbiE
MTDSHSGARVVVDLGCGSRKKLGAIGLDIARIPNVDIVADVMKTLPFRDNSIDEVFASHLVEHTDDLMALMGEVWRICKPGAVVHFRFPHATTPFGIWRDPTHRRGVYLATFNYWDPSTFDGAYFGYYHPAKFKIVKQRLMYNMNADTFLPGRGRRVIGRIVDAVANRNDRWQYFCERFWGHLLGIEECQIWMRALK